MQRLVLQLDAEGGVTLGATQPPIENLVFAGGGERGVVYAGAIKILQSRDMLHNVKRVAGSSTGALSAVVAGMGYNADEFKDICMGIQQSDFTGTKSTLNTIKTFFKSRQEKLGEGVLSGDGMFSGANVYKKLQDIIRKKVLDAIQAYPDLNDLNIDLNKITFRNIHDIIQLHPDLGFKELFILGTNKTDNTQQIFSYDNPETCDDEIALAARISMSLPAVFQTIGLRGKYYQDGGVKNNFPIEIFDQPAYSPASSYCLGEQGQNLCTLGLKVETAENMQYSLWHNKEAELKNASIGKKLQAGFTKFKQKIEDVFTDTIANAPLSKSVRGKKQVIRELYQQRVLQIADQGISTFAFSADDATKLKLIASGSNAAQTWCDAHQGELRFIAASSHFEKLINKLSTQDLAHLCADLKTNKVKILPATPEQAKAKPADYLAIAETVYLARLKVQATSTVEPQEPTRQPRMGGKGR